jgi:hypothetical protein
MGHSKQGVIHGRATDSESGQNDEAATAASADGLADGVERGGAFCAEENAGGKDDGMAGVEPEPGV